MTRPLQFGWGDRVMLVAPHPDDETLAAGGLLQRAVAAHAQLKVVFVSDGEDNPWAQRATEMRWRIRREDRQRWGYRRRGEAMAALTALGVEPAHAEFLGFPDQGITRLLLASDDTLAVALSRELRQFRPTVLVSPSALDLHPDHSALAVTLRRALDGLAARLPQPRQHQYIVHHHGRPGAVAEATVALTPREVQRKRAAILCHASQLTLRRSCLLGFAEGEERFFPPRPPAENASDHPVTRAFIEDEALHVDLERQPRLGAFGRSELLLAQERAGECRVLSAILPRRPGVIEVTDRVTGELVARGRFERLPRGARATLPAALVADWRHVDVKLERRFGFFDEAGWRAILGLPTAAGRIPALEPALAERHTHLTRA